MIYNNKKSSCCGCYFLGRKKDSNSFRSRSPAAILVVVLQVLQGTVQVGQSSFANLETKVTGTSCKNDYFVEVEGQSGRCVCIMLICSYSAVQNQCAVVATSAANSASWKCHLSGGQLGMGFYSQFCGVHFQML